MDTTFTMGHLIQLAVFAFTVAAALLGVWWRIEVRVRGIEDKQSVENARASRELQDYRLHVAQHYASWEVVKDIEKRLNDMPDAVAERIMKFMAIRVAP